MGGCECVCARGGWGRTSLPYLLYPYLCVFSSYIGWMGGRPSDFAATARGWGRTSILYLLYLCLCIFSSYIGWGKSPLNLQLQHGNASPLTRPTSRLLDSGAAGLVVGQTSHARTRTHTRTRAHHTHTQHSHTDTHVTHTHAHTSSHTGAVGLVVGQICKHVHGCRVVGSAGSDDKVRKRLHMCTFCAGVQPQ